MGSWFYNVVAYPFSRALIVVLIGGALGVVDEREDRGAALVHADEVVPARSAVADHAQRSYLRVLEETGGDPGRLEWNRAVP